MTRQPADRPFGPGAAGLPPVGWQDRTLPVLRALADADPAVHALEVTGSAARGGRLLDVWSDLDVSLTTDRDPGPVADRLALAASAALGPVYASSRCAHGQEAGVRLVLTDL
ncbi:hypothetical protein, partial [Kitasatospora sp. NPDC098663]|uniref:hypothetical protein n=1 Tax=Kitasatospora sp. NPDC098663 TaxID=3364096 RepID=UPI0038094EFA